MPDLMSEAEARYIQRLPDQMDRTIKKLEHYLSAYERYGMTLEREAQFLLAKIYGDKCPLAKAEEEYQRAREG